MNPRVIDPAKTFDDLVAWLKETVIEHKKCPGILVGLSGTDSLVTFLAAYRAFEQAGRADRVLGIHFAPSEDFLYDHPEAETHTWFSDKVVFWLKHKAPKAKIIVDTSIDWRQDGIRWGKLADISAVSEKNDRRILLAPEEQYWIAGTRNRTEDELFSYSNASMLASLQPIVRLWKSEVLQIANHLDIPQIAITKACEADCICGRDRLPAAHPRELDLLLMARLGIVDNEYIADHIHPGLNKQLSFYIENQMKRGMFKTAIPYNPPSQCVVQDTVILDFENGTLPLQTFDHRQHVYVAWRYLKSMPLEEATDRFIKYLKVLLDVNNQESRFNLKITKKWFDKINSILQTRPELTFDELMVLLKYN